MSRLDRVPTRYSEAEIKERSDNGEFVFVDEDNVTVSFVKGSYSISMRFTLHFWFFTISKAMTLWDGDVAVLIDFLQKHKNNH